MLKGQKKLLYNTGVCLCLALLVNAFPVLADSLDNYGVKDFLKGDHKKIRFSHRIGFHGKTYRDNLLSRQRLGDTHQDIGSLSLLSDWHPGGGRFRFSAGVVYQDSNASEKSGILSWQIPYQFGNANQLLSGDDNRGVSPYLGLGWARGLNTNKRLGINLDVGVLYQPDRSLFDDSNTTSSYSHGTTRLLHDLEELELNPTFTLGLSYSF